MWAILSPGFVHAIVIIILVYTGIIMLGAKSGFVQSTDCAAQSMDPL